MLGEAAQEMTGIYYVPRQNDEIDAHEAAHGKDGKMRNGGHVRTRAATEGG